MHRALTGLTMMLLASTAIAQTPGPIAGGTDAAATAAPTPAEAAAAQQRAAAEQKQAADAREKAEKQAKADQREAEKQREAAEEQAKEQAKEQERAAAKAAKAEEARTAEAAAAAQKAEAARAAEAAAAAEKAKAAEASAAAIAAAQASGDARDIATQVCLAEAKSRAMAVGATNVTMNEVKDTDKKSDGRANVTAKVNVITMSKGKPKAQKKSIECETRNGTVTKFKWD